MLIDTKIPPHLLEENWESLAQALNTIGSEKAPVFLTKVVLMLAAKLERPETLRDFLDVALQDIEPQQK
ncbi:MAG: hypothetical protein KIT85_05585 [Pseudolabrys sp.]|nr:hypothetical protein [Pseudolabrys sp.]MCW5683849.1 hypothetical protein [Pseudolabrys sp.]